MADPTLTVSSESVCFIIIKAREFDAQDVVTDPDSGSNATDDGAASVLEAHSDDLTQKELVAFINALSEEEQADLVPLLSDHLEEGLSQFSLSCEDFEIGRL